MDLGSLGMEWDDIWNYLNGIGREFRDWRRDFRNGTIQTVMRGDGNRGKRKTGEECHVTHKKGKSFKKSAVSSDTRMKLKDLAIQGLLMDSKGELWSPNGEARNQNVAKWGINEKEIGIAKAECSSK